MITLENFPSVLESLGFIKTGDVYKKEYSQGATIEVDFAAKKIIYSPIDNSFKNGDYPSKENPAAGFVVHRETTLNFSATENFVCLVCVHLLLKKGYEPKHIVFEPSFIVGHVNKPSYGDILVFDKEYNPLVLIENKTYGSEFSREWNNMQKDGGQLFSYLGPLVNKLGLCQNLVLFSADLDENVIIKNHIITLKDNEKRIKDLENPKTFKDAQGKYFDVWNETYGMSFETKGLFEEDIAAYSVGKQKYTVRDLKSLSHAEIRPIYHEFATILRNHAITDFEHSFYILIDLFLCKITDEIDNPNDLQFYYKGIARDTPKEYCARLLKLYKKGKKELFNVDVVNKEEDDIVQIFEDTNRSLTNGLFEGIKELFEEIKFYNIKKFNFIDVENKEEFEQNFQILIKIAALIQDINLSNSETNHFFGDLFEGLLSKNVHQTEGQFFTPLPIVNFIITSLPDFSDGENVKVLDYACGAGHFLTEFIKRYPKANAFGIEKSPNLSQVAKIATIINGNKNARIVFKDALECFDTTQVRFQGFDKESFDCIIANPPYSVKEFLNTLSEKDRNQFELIKYVDESKFETNNSIECFFVERAKFFLKNKGIMGIILPSSILTNGNLYIKTREILFNDFNILAIVNLNSRTFGSTGTNTIILFAQKVKKNSRGLCDTFMSKGPYEQYKIHDGIENYIQKQNYSKDEYFAFMQDEKLSQHLAENEIFKDYEKNFKPHVVKKSQQTEWFKASSFYKDGIKENSKEYRERFQKFLQSDKYKTLEEQEHEKQFIEFAKEIEYDKLNTFIQLENNTVAILQSPPDKIGNKTNKSEVVKFLGYDWSNRKGDEGIKYVTNTNLPKQQNTDENEDKDDKDVEVANAINSIKYIATPLYNPDDDYDTSKFSYALRKHICSQCEKFSFAQERQENENLGKEFSNEMKDLLSYVKLSDMIDFSRATFDKAIKTNTENTRGGGQIYSKFPAKSVENLLVQIEGNKTKIEQNEIKESGKFPVITQESEKLISGYTDENAVITDLPLIVFGDHSCTVKYVDFPFVRGADGTQLLKTNQNEVITKYFYYYLCSVQIENSARYERHFKYLKTTKIPLPPIEVQKKIVAECEKVDSQFQNAQKEIDGCKNQIEEVMENMKGEAKRLSEICSVINPSKSDIRNVSDDTLVSFVDMPSVSNDGFIEKKIDKKLKDIRRGGYTYFAENDIIIAKITPCMENGKCAIARNLTNKIGMGSSEFHVFRIKPDFSTEFVFAYLNRSEIRNMAQKVMTGASGHRRVPITFYEDLKIPLPPLPVQKRIVAQISKLEEKIATAKKVIASCPQQKQAILKSALEK